jgi:hypothetical protein
MINFLHNQKLTPTFDVECGHFMTLNLSKTFKLKGKHWTIS